MKCKLLVTTILILSFGNSFAQSSGSYDYAFNEIHKMLKGETKLDFKKAVFLTENAFYSNRLDYKEFCQKIDRIEIQINLFMRDKGVINHPMGKQFAIFNYMMEPSKYNGNKRMAYDFEDFMGKKDWTKMFVIKLLKTNSGNCHSLPFLYKILSEEVGAEAYLANAPNHLYIKHKDDKGQWINLELTNGSFPRDAWVISSCAITTEAIKKETYMEPLSLSESVALSLFDLAESYKSKFGHNNFTLKCIDTLLKYFPKCIEGYMVKSAIMADKRKSFLSLNNNKRAIEIAQIENEIIGLYNKIDDMGYKEMPKDQYEQWVMQMDEERKKKQQGKEN